MSPARATLTRWDRRLLAAAVARRSPARDAVMTTASRAANRSVLWAGIAAGLAATGRRRDRTAAASGLLGIGIAATLANGPLKFAWRRKRPPLVPGGTPPLLRLPRTFSFPSGHSASAFAFAVGATRAMPAAGPVVLPAAATVAYSRVHTGVHYPSDVAVGAAVGTASGLAAAAVVRRVRQRSVHHPDAPALDVPIPSRAVVVESPAAGSAGDLPAALAVLIERGTTVVERLRVDEPGAADRLRAHVAGDDPPLVVAAGGDGTVGWVSGHVADTDAVLFPLPLGTSNDVARSLGIPPDAREAAAGLRDGRVCAVDAGRVAFDGTDGCTFLNAATIGLNVAFAKEATRRSVRARFGGLTYPVAAARAVRRYAPFDCVVEVDGQPRELEIVHLSVSNAPVFGGLLGMRVPGASMTDGLLDVTLVERLSRTRVGLALAQTLVGTHRPVPRVRTLRARELRVEAAVAGGGAQQVAVDGEVVGTLPVSFTVRPGAVRVACPWPPAGRPSA